MGGEGPAMGGEGPAMGDEGLAIGHRSDDVDAVSRCLILCGRSHDRVARDD